MLRVRQGTWPDRLVETCKLRPELPKAHSSEPHSKRTGAFAGGWMDRKKLMSLTTASIINFAFIAIVAWVFA